MESKETNDENGRCLTIKLALRCKPLSTAARRTLRDGCIARVVCESPDCCAVSDLYLGSEDIPLRFDLEDNLDVLRLSVTHKTLSRL
mgnify:CR=1 FL=1